MGATISESGVAATGGDALAVHYVDAAGARALLEAPDRILGVAGYGAGRPGFLPEACPFIEVPLRPAGGRAMFEVWSGAELCRPFRRGAVSGACNGDLAFGAVAIDEPGHATLEDAVAAAYHDIFDFLDETEFAAPIRFWNYLTAITEEKDGLERYRRFNIGRHQAFSGRLRQSRPPAASGVGGAGGSSVIYFLAAHEPAVAVENPRQVSAYAYPPIYGPRSPSFSRASLHRLGGMRNMFISGTASITGHESRHRADLQGQIGETIANLRALMEAAPADAAAWAFKAYLHDEAYLEPVEQALVSAFGADSQRLYLRGEMCRAELMIEIEAFGQGTQRA